MDKITATVTKTIEVEMKPYLAFLYFDLDGVQSCKVQYGEYHNGVLHKILDMQDAPEENAAPVLAAVYGAMEAKAKATLDGLATKAPEDYDNNEKYLAALLEASSK